MAYTADGQIAMGAAETLSVSDDQTVYTFHLRPDARWSNGEPVTAEDFVFTFRRLADPATKAEWEDEARKVLVRAQARELAAPDPASC